MDFRIRIHYQSVLGLLLVFLSLAVHAASHNPEQFLKSIRGQADEGQQIVQQFCANCHALRPLINLGAPRPGIKADWQARWAQGWPLIWQHTEEGYQAMPARGGCFECSDRQLILAIQALLPDIYAKKMKHNKKQKDHK